MSFLKKFLEWFKGNKTKEEETVIKEVVEEAKEECVSNESVEENKVDETVNEEVTFEEESLELNVHTHCNNCSKFDECFIVEFSNEYAEDIENIDWDNLTLSTINALTNIDLHCFCDDIINWYKISKMIGLPDEFLRKYKDKIIWKEYNKRYLKKATKEMLKNEGYID